jgi:DNA-directed RNA polymerase sigma subunit (sigma70/sigma32)
MHGSLLSYNARRSDRFVSLVSISAQNSEPEVAWLREAIRRLPQKARYVLVRRYGLDDRDPATLAKLAAELNLSRERVRQLQREAEFLLKSGTKRVPRPSVARGCPSPKA